MAQEQQLTIQNPNNFRVQYTGIYKKRNYQQHKVLNNNNNNNGEEVVPVLN
jgi:hypothetical protein